jgi:hypothetical protein
VRTRLSGYSLNMKFPVLDLELHKPTRGSLAWYGTVGLMSAAGLLEWPVAVVLTTGHLIAENSRSETVASAGEGAESAAG